MKRNRSFSFFVLAATFLTSPIFANTTSDTTWFSANKSVKSITTYQSKVLSQYEEFHINGNKKYTVNYHYENDSLRTETLHTAEGTEFAIGKYFYDSTGYQYKYYSSTGEHFSTSYYSPLGYLLEYDELTPNGSIYYATGYSYDSLGFMTDEWYYNGNATLTARATWAYDPSSGRTTYHYTLLTDTVLINSSTGDSYDEYITYYSKSIYQKDSTVVFKKGTPVYSARYFWDSNGYMTNDSYSFPDGSASSKGTYQFNKNDFTTQYTYSYLNDSTVWETTSDFQGLTTKTDVFSGKSRISSTIYRYNDLLYVDSVLYYGTNNSLMAVDQYTYYDPFTWVKTYLSQSSTGDTLKYYRYDSNGKVVESVGIQNFSTARERATVITLPTELVISGIETSATFSIHTLQGRIVRTGEFLAGATVRLQTNDIARGYYLLSIKTANSHQAIPVIIR